MTLTSSSCVNSVNAPCRPVVPPLAFGLGFAGTRLVLAPPPPLIIATRIGLIFDRSWVVTSSLFPDLG